jgi:hypothetical protein
MGYEDYTGSVFSVPFTGAAVTSTAPYDLLTIIGSTSMRTELLKLHIGELSSNINNDQQIGVTFLRGTVPSSGASLPVQNTKGWPGATTSGAIVTGITASLASTTNAVDVWADATDHGGDYEYIPFEPGEIKLDYGQALTVRLTQPAASIVLNGTLMFRETNKG